MPLLELGLLSLYFGTLKTSTKMSPKNITIVIKVSWVLSRLLMKLETACDSNYKGEVKNYTHKSTLCDLMRKIIIKLLIFWMPDNWCYSGAKAEEILILGNRNLRLY